MITGWTIYWITRLDTILDACCPIAIFGILFGAIGFFVTRFILVDKDSLSEVDFKLLSQIKNLGAVFLCSGLLSAAILIFLPSSKTAAAMCVVPAIVNNQKVQEMPQNLLDLSNAWIKSQTEKLTPKENE